MKKWSVREKWLGGGLVVSILLSLVLGMDRLQLDLGDENIKTVTRVIDGDVVVFEDNSHGRLVGIDAPEKDKGCLGEKARTRLEELVSGKKVEVVETGKRSFERDLVWVRVDGVSVNKIMVQEGLAVKYEDYTTEIEMAEDEAKALKKGLWSKACLPQKEGCVIKGNYRNSGDRKYHLPDCYNYKKIDLDPTQPDEWFCTDEEAREAGFLKSKDCPGMK